MARHQSYTAAHANAQLNANESGQVWVVFNDTSGVWNAEPGRSRETWSGVTFEEVHPQRYKVVVERSGTQVLGKTEVVLWTDDWSAAQRACETAARHVDAVQAFVYDVRPSAVANRDGISAVPDDRQGIESSKRYEVRVLVSGRSTLVKSGDNLDELKEYADLAGAFHTRPHMIIVDTMKGREIVHHVNRPKPRAV